ncbi:MAG: asparagine synthase (glutamine-hydrolyzing) [Chloroflexota bacterium]|nr:asparagine synthase (glutamine-hydrolyzing) [Chloroflexota bacterium]MDE2945726.1 asparagine synthase (glutamine-hydrolyzing) [Chloroflexota bacterium]
MCGICGVIHFDGKPVSRALLTGMNERLAHRGPDGAGYFSDGNIGLAMRRLKIIDIAGSDQPLSSEDGSVVLIFNGEIYNYRALRRQLMGRGHRFKTDGDGETIAHLYEDHGPDALKHLRGMFALALWDGRRRRLLLARDRFGQKPLYYYANNKVFAFASEIKALLAHPAIPRVSRFEGDDRRALAAYLSFGYVPAPQTAFAGIHMLQPASALHVEPSGATREQRYWDLPPLAPPEPAAKAATYVGDLREQLAEAVKLRLISDVPLGAFLSGGLDSSLIVALMRRGSNSAIKTFSIGFAGDETFDESLYAEKVARHLETEHSTFRVEPEALSLLSDLVRHHDQPFADSSAIPTYLVSKLTREQVTVALTGDGGDELFAGYERFYAVDLMRKLQFMPGPFLRGAAELLRRLPEGTGYYDPIKRARRFARAASQGLADAYFDLVRIFDATLLADICPKADPTQPTMNAYMNPGQTQPVAELVQANMRSYLPDDLLIKADRCSMAASLETRAPFLDHELAESAAIIPFNLKLKGSRSKHILKEAAQGLLPPEIIDRKKHGFGVPLGAWLRRDMAPMRELLLSRRARERGLLEISAVERLIAEHEAGARDHNRQLWALLTLEEWHRQFVDG